MDTFLLQKIYNPPFASVRILAVLPVEHGNVLQLMAKKKCDTSKRWRTKNMNIKLGQLSHDILIYLVLYVHL